MSYFVLGFRSYFRIIINRTFHCLFKDNDFEYIYFFHKHAVHSVVCVKCLSLVLEHVVLVGSMPYHQRNYFFLSICSFCFLLIPLFKEH